MLRIRGTGGVVRVFPVVLPSGERYWTVLDEQLAVVEAADAFLRHARFGRDQAELTTRAYASAVALFLRWYQRTHMHFMPDSAALGCAVQGAHVHVVRRLNANGAWAKSVRQRWVPADGLVVRAYDQYVMERLALPHGDLSDFALVNLFRGRLGEPVSVDAVTELFGRLGDRAGLPRSVTAHMLRHVLSA